MSYDHDYKWLCFVTAVWPIDCWYCMLVLCSQMISAAPKWPKQTVNAGLEVIICTNANKLAPVMSLYTTLFLKTRQWVTVAWILSPAAFHYFTLQWLDSLFRILSSSLELQHMKSVEMHLCCFICMQPFSGELRVCLYNSQWEDWCLLLKWIVDMQTWTDQRKASRLMEEIHRKWMSSNSWVWPPTGGWIIPPPTLVPWGENKVDKLSKHLREATSFCWRSWTKSINYHYFPWIIYNLCVVLISVFNY